MISDKSISNYEFPKKFMVSVLILLTCFSIYCQDKHRAKTFENLDSPVK